MYQEPDRRAKIQAAYAPQYPAATANTAPLAAMETVRVDPRARVQCANPGERPALPC